MRLIDADAIHKFVEDKVAEGKDVWANGVCYELAWTLTVIDSFPTIEAEPVKHGLWKLVGADKLGRGGNWKCDGRDGCGKLFPFKCNYCPNCGAKMDLEG